MSTADFTPTDLADMLYGAIGDVLRPLIVLYLERYGETIILDACVNSEPAALVS